MDWGIPVGANASVRSPGLFAFWGRENLQTPVLESLSDVAPPSTAIEFALEHIKRAILLTCPSLLPIRLRFQREKTAKQLPTT
jgi:hypothetical protein